MDGFYVAKFRVEKRTKSATVREPDSAPAVVTVDEMSQQVEEDVGFDSEEDRPYLEGLCSIGLLVDWLSDAMFQTQNVDV
jgi:hypothetical protein